MNRKNLKHLYKTKDALREEIQRCTANYITQLDGKKGIYLSDHSIVRYLERIKGHVFPKGDYTDEQLLATYPGYIGDVREEMLTLEEDRKILHGQITYFRRGEYNYIIKELAVVTVLLN